MIELNVRETAAATKGTTLPSTPRYVPFIIASSISCSFFRSSSVSGCKHNQIIQPLFSKNTFITIIHSSTTSMCENNNVIARPGRQPVRYCYQSRHSVTPPRLAELCFHSFCHSVCQQDHSRPR